MSGPVFKTTRGIAAEAGEHQHMPHEQRADSTPARARSDAQEPEVELAVARERRDRPPGARGRRRAQKHAARGIRRHPDLMVARPLGHCRDLGAVALAQREVVGIGGLCECRDLADLVVAHEPDAHVGALLQGEAVDDAVHAAR